MNIAAEKADMETLMFVKAKMDDISKENPHLKDLNPQNIATEELSVEDDHLFPKVPLFFKIARVKGIENGTILLEISKLNLSLLLFVEMGVL